MLPIPTHLKDILLVDEKEFDGNSICGKIGCTCGCRNIKLNIYANEHKDYIGVKKYKDNYGFRIAGTCGECGKQFDIFDMAKHGYDGFVCQDGISVEDTDLWGVTCGKCQGDMFDVNIEIELEDQEQFVEEVVEDAPEKYAPEDYVDAFNWFNASLQCKKCGRKMHNWVSLETS